MFLYALDFSSSLFCGMEGWGKGVIEVEVEVGLG